jgi:hypothetical protein
LGGVDLRVVIGCALVFAIGAGAVAAAGERDYRARSFVIRVAPQFGGTRGIGLARSEPVLRRTLVLAGERARDTRWLRRHSSVELTSRRDLALTVETPEREATVVLATGYAKAVRRSLPRVPGLATRGRGARDAQPELGPVGWALLGGAAGLWVGAAVSILREGLVRSGSARAARRASPPGAPARRATPG